MTAVISSTANGKAQSVVFAQRWAGFVAAIWLMALSGSYGFSNYSTALKEVLGLNQKQLNRLSVAKDLGDSFGIIAGILSAYLPARVLLCIGACVGFIGNGTQWLVISGLIRPPPYWAMFAMAMLAGNTISWFNTSVFTLSVRNFPRNRGPVAGLFKAYMGLSAAIFSSICDTFFSSSSSMYLLMMSTIPPLFSLLTAIFFRPVPPSETPEDVKAEQRSLSAFTVMSMALAILLVAQNLVPGINQGALQQVFTGLFGIVLVAPAFVPLAVFFMMKRKPLGVAALVEVEDADSLSVSTVAEDAQKKLVSNGLYDTKEEGLRKPLLNQDSLLAEGIKPDNSPAMLKLGEDRSTLSLFKTWHVYVLYLSLFCAVGSGMSFSNNLGQVGQSLGFDTVTLFTSLFSLGNFFGRIAAGNASEYSLKKKGTPRPAWIGLAKVPMIAFLVWLSLGSAASLYAGSFVLGFSHGSSVALTIPTISEFYGLKYFGTNYMVINTHILAGSTVFSGIVAGYLYDMYATYRGDGGTLICYGASCYGITFCVCAGFLTVALFCDGVLTFFSRPLYRKLQDINNNIAPALK